MTRGDSRGRAGERPLRVLFVCLGNSCRSQMAEGFARAYGRDVLEPHSAGLMPAGTIAPGTWRVMAEKSISLVGQFPKALEDLQSSDYDLIINLCEFDLPACIVTPVRCWDVRDPMGSTEEVYRNTRDQIEGLVMGLILELRRKQNVLRPQAR